MGKVDTFIGKTFDTPKGSTITITGLCPREKYVNGELKSKKYTCICSLCNKDEELYGTHFEVKKYNIEKAGNIPCGCSTNTKYTKEQYKVLIDRLCNEKNYKFIAFGTWVGSKTKLTLQCSKHGTWDTTSLECFLSGTGCPSCGHEAVAAIRRLSDNQFTESVKHLYIEGTVFNRIGSNRWNIICPVCSEDEYVKEGLCNGVFEGNTSSIQAGKKSCRCSKHYSFTKEQREYQIKNKLLELEGTFIGWETGFKDSKSKVIWECKNGHTNIHPVGSLVAGQSNCNNCSQGHFGFYPEREKDTDTLYMIRFYSDKEEFIKIGRSFNLEQRLDYFSKYYKVQLLSKATMKHKQILKLEQDYHTYLKGKGLSYTPLLKFSGSHQECFRLEAKDLCYF